MAWRLQLAGLALPCRSHELPIFSAEKTPQMSYPGKIKMALILTLLALGACREQQPPSSAAQPGLHPVATIQDIMQSLVDPSADSLWESVSTTITAEGTEEKQPRSDAEWAAVRHHAIALVEAANLLVVPHRKIAAQGKMLEDAHVAGINTPDVIQTLVEADRAQFAAYAQRMQEASVAALSAIDRRDVPALIEAGGNLDRACEQCHAHYWYPNSPKPPEL